MPKEKQIHTINARGNIMLEVVRDYFKITPERMYYEIHAMFSQIDTALSKKGVDYSALKNALVPNRKRQEVALLFNTVSLEDTWYGYAVFERLIPLLNKKAKHSILVGDYIGSGTNQEILFEALEESVELVRSVEYLHSNQFFVVYINNLTDGMIKAIIDGLREWEPFIGHADMTYSSKLKVFLSTMLCDHCVKIGDKILQGHEPDRDNVENINMSGYPYEGNGYKCLSLSSDLFGVFLNYKIERPVFDGFETDTEFSLNAISMEPLSLKEFSVEVEPAKLKYLKGEKAGSLKAAGLGSVETEELARIIKSKISSSYIYNLSFVEEHQTSKFNIIIELSGSADKPYRFLASLEYQPASQNLRVITFF